MKDIDNELELMRTRIKRDQEFIIRLNNSQEEDKDELIKITNNEILFLQRKVKILEEKQKKGIYIPPKPELGDERYKNFSDKNALDILRVLYYDYFYKDPSLSFVSSDYVMFGDDTLPLFVSTYLIRGEIPFKLMLTTCYQDYMPKDNFSIGINFDRNDLLKENGLEYLKLMSTLITRYSNNEINFICGDGVNRNCTLAYIGDNAFSYYSSSKERDYYDFFARLCDNIWRNIIYIGDTMKQNTRMKDIEKANFEIIIRQIEFIAENLGITTEQLIQSNEEFSNKILTLSRKQYRLL